MDCLTLLGRNIERLMREREYRSYAQAARISGVNLSTLKSWMCGRKYPRLKTLDAFCDGLYIRTWELFREGPEFSRADRANHSDKTAIVNFRACLLEKKLLRTEEILAYFQGELSLDEYRSYLRNTDGRNIPLPKLERLAALLEVPLWKLLKEEFSNETEQPK